jgi:hypothetical protein
MSQRVRNLLIAVGVLSVAGGAVAVLAWHKAARTPSAAAPVLEYLHATVARQDVEAVAFGNAKKPLTSSESKKMMDLFAKNWARFKRTDNSKASPPTLPGAPVALAPSAGIDVQVRGPGTALAQVLVYAHDMGDHVSIGIFSGPCEGLYYFEGPFPEFVEWLNKATSQAPAKDADIAIEIQRIVEVTGSAAPQGSGKALLLDVILRKGRPGGEPLHVSRYELGWIRPTFHHADVGNVGIRWREGYHPVEGLILLRKGDEIVLAEKPVPATLSMAGCELFAKDPKVKEIPEGMVTYRLDNTGPYSYDKDAQLPSRTARIVGEGQAKFVRQAEHQ